MAMRWVGRVFTGARGQQRSRSGEVMLFVLLSCALSWTAWMSLRWLGMPLAPSMLIAMFGPLLAARILTQPGMPASLVTLETGGGGWLSRLRGATGGAVLALAMVSAGVLLSVFAGDLGIRSGFHASLARLGAEAPVVMGFYGLSLLAAYGEEYGWRGFLHSRLLGFGPLGAALITGPVWALWHSPAIVFDGFDYPHHRLAGLAMLVVLFVPLSIVMSWLRESSGGLAAPTAAHAVFNLGAGALALFTVHTSSVVAAPVGLLGFVPFAIVAIWLVGTGRVTLMPRDHHHAAATVGKLVPQPVTVYSQ